MGQRVYTLGFGRGMTNLRTMCATICVLYFHFLMISMIVQAVSVGQQEFLAIAISADLAEEFVGPCGACRSAYSMSTPPPPHPILEVENINRILPCVHFKFVPHRYRI